MSAPLNARVALIGTGNLGEALLKGWLNDPSIAPSQLSATRRNREKLLPYANSGIALPADNRSAASEADIVVLAVKPYNAASVLDGFADVLVPGNAVVSVATGVSISAIASRVPNGVEVYRAMPNTGADVGESMTCLSGSGQRHRQVLQLFQGLGAVITIDESLMEAATVLGACGIAYVMRFMRAMVQGGIQIGFSAETASDIVNQTVKGAAALLVERGLHPEEEIDKVTTPKGCTIVGLNEMEHHGFSSSLIKGIVASHRAIQT